MQDCQHLHGCLLHPVNKNVGSPWDRQFASPGAHPNSAHHGKRAQMIGRPFNPINLPRRRRPVVDLNVLTRFAKMPKRDYSPFDLHDVRQRANSA